MCMLPFKKKKGNKHLKKILKIKIKIHIDIDITLLSLNSQYILISLILHKKNIFNSIFYFSIILIHHFLRKIRQTLFPPKKYYIEFFL